MNQAMQRLSRVSSFWFLVFTGCNSANQTVEVKGIVTLDDRPVSGATVVFLREGGHGRPASALTDQEGYFSLTTFRDGDGALPGDYRVIVKKAEGSSAPPPDIDPADHKSVTAHYKNLMERNQAKPALPAIYANETTTPLRCTVPAEKIVTLELQSKPKK
jgi:hypothetical protein